MTSWEAETWKLELQAWKASLIPKFEAKQLVLLAWLSLINDTTTSRDLDLMLLTNHTVWCCCASQPSDQDRTSQIKYNKSKNQMISDVRSWSNDWDTEQHQAVWFVNIKSKSHKQKAKSYLLKHHLNYTLANWRGMLPNSFYSDRGFWRMIFTNLLIINFIFH
jgi:hypothetical protein